jgi:hypothetical protein
MSAVQPLNGPAPRPAYRPWTVTDLALLRQHWPAQGTRAVQALLSTPRSEAAIRVTAKRIGLRRDNRSRRPYRRYPQNDFVDQQIRAAYATGPPGAIKALSARLGRDYGWVRWRAMQLGCRPVRIKAPDWVPDEEALLERYAGQGVRRIQTALRRAGYQRSLRAIYERLYRHGLDLHDDGYLTLPRIAQGMGVDSSVVARWVERYGLPTHRRETHDGSPHPARYVTRAALRKWVAANVLLVDVRKVDKHWFIDLLVHTRDA